MDMNHWGVALKITGFLHLQQWGYEWTKVSFATRSPLASIFSIILTSALKTN
jgi:hypothetical protein